MKVKIELDGVSAEVSSETAITINEALELVQQALLGVGFCFRGDLEIIEDLESDKHGQTDF